MTTHDRARVYHVVPNVPGAIPPMDAPTRARARAQLEAFALDQPDPVGWFTEMVDMLGLRPNQDPVD